MEARQSKNSASNILDSQGMKYLSTSTKIHLSYFFLKTFVEKVSSTTHLSSFFSRLLLRAKWAYFSRHICLLRRVHLLENNTKKHYTFFTNNNLPFRFFKTWFIAQIYQVQLNLFPYIENGKVSKINLLVNVENLNLKIDFTSIGVIE